MRASESPSKPILTKLSHDIDDKMHGFPRNSKVNGERKAPWQPVLGKAAYQIALPGPFGKSETLYAKVSETQAG